jgi:hypothetical protein
VRPVFLLSVTFVAAFLLGIAPWALSNASHYQDPFPTLRLSPPNTVSPTFITDGSPPPPNLNNVRTLPSDLVIDLNNPACKGNSKVEELDRYWGNYQGWTHYVTLPWRTAMNVDSFGYYVTLVPALLLFPLLLLLPYFWTKKGRALRWLFASTLFILVQWIFFANGVPWYGIGMFLGLCVGLEAFIAHAPDRSSKILASVLLTLSFFVAYANRFWQAEQQRNLFTYAIGVVSADAMQERTIPHYGLISQYVTERAATMPDTPYTYRIGTFIPYFIPKNLEIVPLADNQLDFFTCLNQDKNPALTLKRLKALGFNGLIFDTNTQTIEKDPNGTLHRKVNQFLDFINTPALGLRAVVNDPDGGIAYVLFP